MSAAYVLKRCVLMVYTLLVVSLIVFGVTQILPADAAVMIMGENATAEQPRPCASGSASTISASWHAAGRRPTGDFGVSTRTGLPVLPTMLDALSRSLTLAALSIVLMLVVAVPIGIVAATRRGKLADVVFGIISYLGVSLPEFVTATMVILVLADWLQLLPATGYVPLSEDLWRGLQHLVLLTGR
jgi:peptide/nickel transport system permease protein